MDANGNKILNYKVGYQYEVINKEFSAKEDFPSGGYDIERSNAAMSLMKIIKNAFEGDFSKYLSEGKPSTDVSIHHYVRSCSYSCGSSY